MKTNASRDYAKEHIPGAVRFNFEAAYYPSRYIRNDLYPPEEFEKYVQKLGINTGDHIVIYARGRFAGMLYAARAWWTFRAYGHDKVSVLDGGLDAWRKAGKPVTNTIHLLSTNNAHSQHGNWKAKSIDKALLITFEELDEMKPNGKSLFEDLTKINYLDARPGRLFTGKEPFEFPGKGATGSHLKGAKNVPLSAVMNEDGMKSKDMIEKALENAGFDISLPTVTACTQGFQAALLSIALRRAGIESRMYNGSMHEIALRNPKMISEQGESEPN